MNTLPFEILINPQARHDSPYTISQSAMLSLDGLGKAKSIITQWPAYAATPLVDLPGIAKTFGVTSVHYKDEAYRRYIEPLLRDLWVQPDDI